MKLALLKLRYEALSLREQAMLVLAVVAVLVFLLDLVLLAPLSAQQTQLERQLDNQQRLQQALTITVSSQKTQSAQLEQLRAAIKKQQAQLELTQGALDKGLAQLVSPEQMLEMLKDVLQDGKLSLVALENLPVQAVQLNPLGAVDEPVRDDSSVAGLYRHRLLVNLRGGYSDVVDYLQRLEQQPWKVMWRSLNYQVQDYPAGTLELELQTLSRNPQLLGYKQ